MGMLRCMGHLRLATVIRRSRLWHRTEWSWKGDRERPRGRSRRNVPDKMAVCFGGAKVEPTTVQMDDRPARPPIRRKHPKSRYAAQGVFFECHVLSWQYALHESVVLSASFDAWSRAFAGAEHGAHGGGDRCVFGIERMYLGHSGTSILAAQSGSFVSVRPNSRSRPAMSAL